MNHLLEMKLAALGVGVGGEDRQHAVVAGIADQDGAAGRIAERAVPDAGDVGDLDDHAAAVPGDGGAAPLRGGGQVDGTAEVIDLPDSVEPLVEYYRSISGEHPDWAEYRQAMVDQGKSLIRVTVQRWGPLATGGFPARLVQ